MKLEFTESAMRDYKWWKRHDPMKARRIEKLCNDILLQKFTGMGKPEPLKFDLQGYWSRRIDKVNRLVYSIEDDKVTVISCRYHY